MREKHSKKGPKKEGGTVSSFKAGNFCLLPQEVEKALEEAAFRARNATGLKPGETLTTRPFESLRGLRFRRG